EPDDVGAERGDVVEPLDDPADVADAVAVRVRERARVDLVDDGGPPPVRVAHRGGVRVRRRGGARAVRRGFGAGFAGHGGTFGGRRRSSSTVPRSSPSRYSPAAPSRLS